MKAGKKAKTYEMDMCSGPIFIKIVVFAVPLILSGILQLLFNAADIIVVGRFAGSESLAAVGSTSALINLLVNVFIGLSVGANVMVARFYGAGQQRDLEETVHTAMVMAAVGGAFLVLVGVVLADPLLTLMGTPDDVLPLSALYMKIFFVGMPVNLIYNFGSAILRAVGDTKRPLYFLLINVVLNLFFVIALSMGVAGVALATVISQCVSAFLIVRCLMKTDAGYRLELRKLRVVKNKARSIVKIGLPAGLQGAIFSVSNVLIQSSVNSFGCPGKTAFGDLLLGRGGDPVWDESAADHRDHLLRLRAYGLHGGLSAGHGILGDAHDRVSHRGLRASGAVDLYRVCHEPDAADALHILSRVLGDHVCGPSGVLPGGDQEGEEADGSFSVKKYNRH